MTTTMTTTKTKKTTRPTIPDTTPTAHAPLEALVGDLSSGPRMVDVDRLVPHPRNPRTSMDPDDLQALADSIRAQGVRQNLLVVPDPGEGGRHLIVIGHRRAAAAKLAGLAQVPAVVDPDLSEAQQLELMLVENIQRSDLTVVEEADGFQGLLDLGMTRAQIQKATGVGKSKLSTRLKVAKLPDPARAKLATGQATLDDVVALEAFTGKTQEELVEALGTRDFGWKLSQAKREKKERAQRREFAAACKERGIAISDNIDSSRWRRSESVFISRAVKWLGDRPDLTSSDVVFTTSYGGYTVYEPRSEDEQADAQESGERIRQDRVRREQLQSDLDTAASLRHAFLTPLTTGTTKLPPNAADALTGFAAAWFLTPEGNYVGHLALHASSWLGIYDDQDESEEIDEVQEILENGIPGPRALLAIIAALTEGFDDAYNGYYHPVRSAGYIAAWTEGSRIRGWYTLLQALGYTPSQWELDRLAGEPLPEPPVVEL